MEASTKITFKIHNWSSHQGDIEDRLAIRLSFDLDDHAGAIRVEGYSDEGKINSGKRCLTLDEMLLIDGLVAGIAISHIGSARMGCDREYFSLRIERQSPYAVTLEWWVSPLPCWHGVSQLTDALTGLGNTVKRIERSPSHARHRTMARGGDLGLATPLNT